jgi:heme/copper-type cytochrome/quinol oxidase subunit 1
LLVGGIVSAGVSFAMADVAKHADPSVLQTLNIFSEDVTSFAGAATALLIGATSVAIVRSKALPTWLAYVGLLLAAASFAIPVLGFLGVALWWLLTSIVILVTSRHPVVIGVSEFST